MKKNIYVFIPLIMLLFLTSCTAPAKSESLKVTGIYFDTVIQIEAWGVKTDTLEHCKELCETYENLFSNKIPSSEISRINAAAGASVSVSGETIELLKKGIYYSELSGGKFDITIAPASELWNFKENGDAILPNAEALAEAVSHIDYKTIQIEGNTVTLSDPQAKLDLGGIAKGYIADRIKEYLQEEGVEHAWINLGGNVLTIGTRYDGTPFRIGIQRPFDEQGNSMTTVEVTDCSVVSSGIYERYFEKDGVLYHHILDPSTGYPFTNDLLQVTILSEYSADGDALSTCCFALGLDEGSRLIESLNGVQAIFVTKDYKLHTAGSLE